MNTETTVLPVKSYGRNSTQHYSSIEFCPLSILLNRIRILLDHLRSIHSAAFHDIQLPERLREPGVALNDSVSLVAVPHQSK